MALAFLILLEGVKMNSCHVLSVLLTENLFLRFNNACLDIGCFPDSIIRDLILNFVLDQEAEKNLNKAKK